MKISKNIFSIVAVLLILSFVVSMVASTGITNAQTEKPTFPFIDAVPRTVGVGQRTLINYGLLNFLYADGDGWNVTARITLDGKVVKEFEGMTWSTGTRGDSFTPTEVGEYELQCIYKGEYYNSASATYRGNYAASESDIVILTVQEEPVPQYPGFDLPGKYWTRPVDSQIREWWTIMGSWVAIPQNLYAPWNDAPKSAHILWTMPYGSVQGGVSGGDNLDIAYQNGDAYEGKFAGSIIVGGILFYNRYPATSYKQEIVAVDLHTGKTLWEKTYNFGGSRIARGQTLNWLCLNNRGSFSYVWMVSGTNMFALEPMTGELVYNMTNVPGGTIYYGENGEMLKYAISGNANTGYRLTQWNSSWVVTNGKTGMQESWGSQVQGRTYNAGTLGYDVNVSLTTGLTGNILTVLPGNRIIVGTVSVANGVTLSAINLDPSYRNVGDILFANVNTAAPKEWSEGLTVTGSIGQAGWGAFGTDPLVAVYWTKENRVNYVFSLETGKYLWKSDSQVYADAWSDTTTAAYGPERIILGGRLIEASVGGIVYCYNATTGDELWTYEARDKYAESYISPNWWLVPLFATDKMVYFGHMEHSSLEPKPRGAPFFALEVEEGKVVWEIDGAFRQTRWGGRAIMGDSIIVTLDTYDTQIYAIGKGPVELTFSAPNFAVQEKTSVILKGTIMDVSPGTESDSMKLRFPNGVPAVSDESMSEWMLHVYKQFPEPMVKGVEIQFYTIDPNGNDYALGTATSDARGAFVFEFKPEVSGEYQIYAIFSGSESYYGESVQDTLIVSEAAQEPERIPYELYIIVMGIVVVIVNLIVVLLFARKK